MADRAEKWWKVPVLSPDGTAGDDGVIVMAPTAEVAKLAALTQVGEPDWTAGDPTETSRPR